MSHLTTHAVHIRVFTCFLLAFLDSVMNALNGVSCRRDKAIIFGRSGDAAETAECVMHHRPWTRSVFVCLSVCLSVSLLGRHASVTTSPYCWLMFSQISFFVTVSFNRYRPRNDQLWRSLQYLIDSRPDAVNRLCVLLLPVMLTIISSNRVVE